MRTIRRIWHEIYMRNRQQQQQKKKLIFISSHYEFKLLTLLVIPVCWSGQGQIGGRNVINNLINNNIY